MLRDIDDINAISPLLSTDSMSGNTACGQHASAVDTPQRPPLTPEDPPSQEEALLSYVPGKLAEAREAQCQLGCFLA